MSQNKRKTWARYNIRVEKVINELEGLDYKGTQEQAKILIKGMPQSGSDEVEVAQIMLETFDWIPCLDVLRKTESLSSTSSLTIDPC